MNNKRMHHSCFYFLILLFILSIICNVEGRHDTTKGFSIANLLNLNDVNTAQGEFLSAVDSPPLNLTRVVQTLNGPVQGFYYQGIQQFLGIPFAAPPVGSLRWRVPQPVNNWTEVLMATSFGDACLQPPYQQYLPPQSEDCLYINIYAPANATQSSNLPVMFWVHVRKFSCLHRLIDYSLKGWWLGCG
jgi:hypothetical protein